MAVLLSEAQARIAKRECVLETTLTKRMSEDLCEFFVERGLNASFLHSGVSAIGRLEILDTVSYTHLTLPTILLV